LKEVFRVTDESGEFYFQYPRKIKEAPDGTFFVLDKEQLLQFDKMGKFIRILFKFG
jgi:hypothetical protein